jgi:hypothetical protein
MWTGAGSRQVARLGQDPWVKAKDLSTDQGQLQVLDASGRAYFTSEPLLGLHCFEGGGLEAGGADVPGRGQ